MIGLVAVMPSGALKALKKKAILLGLSRMGNIRQYMPERNEVVKICAVNTGLTENSVSGTPYMWLLGRKVASGIFAYSILR